MSGDEHSVDGAKPVRAHVDVSAKLIANHSNRPLVRVRAAARDAHWPRGRPNDIVLEDAQVSGGTR
jgi:hypothetical protein